MIGTGSVPRKGSTSIILLTLLGLLLWTYTVEETIKFIWYANHLIGPCMIGTFGLKTVSGQCPRFIPPGNTRKPLIFLTPWYAHVGVRIRG